MHARELTEAYRLQRHLIDQFRRDGFVQSVDDPAKTLEQIDANGGKTVLPVMEVPNGPTIALFADPAGNTIGLRKA